MNLDPARVAVAALAVVLLAGCGGMSLWPFGESESTELSRFYVRTLDAGAVWLIAPDREIRLDKLAGAEGARYGVGRVVLEISGQSAMLTDPPTQFADCKRADAKP